MQAYKCNSGDKVVLREDASTPPGAPAVLKGDVFTVGRVDGMYVNGTLHGNRAYIAAWTEVEVSG